uniref:Uncharacterized protein n=2 Tax=Pseudomonas syringae TaxID=317 RepID=A0A2P0QFS3_PSESF|nr:hypothetical protein [Pseudomonas syringae pv. actinidiae]
MTMKIMLLAAMPFIAFLVFHAFKRRSAVGLGLLLGVGVMMSFSYGVGLNAGCGQPFCVDWNSGFDQFARR